MLTLTFLGVGDAFAKRNYKSNALIEAWTGTPQSQAEPEQVMLLDFGTTGPLALHALKDLEGFGYLAHQGRINYPRISHVFVTHQHADHIGGLEELALMNAFVFAETGGSAGRKPLLISSTEILGGLWDHSLRGGLEVMRERYARLEDYFLPLPLTPSDERSGFMLIGRYRFTAFPTDHLRLPGSGRWPSIGLSMRDVTTGQSAFYSGDTRFDPKTYGGLMASARVAFHEAYLGSGDPGVHTTLADLCMLPADVKKKTWLYHYGDDWDSGLRDAELAEFAGLARPFQRYVLFE